MSTEENQMFGFVLFLFVWFFLAAQRGLWDLTSLISD